MHFSLCIHGESFAVIEAEFGIPHSQRPHFLCIIFLDEQQVVFKMRREVERRELVVAVLIDSKYSILVFKLAEIVALSVVVEAVDVGVEPHLSSSESGVSFLLQADGFDVELSEQVAPRGFPLDHQL